MFKAMEGQKKLVWGTIALVVVVGLIWWGSNRQQVEPAAGEPIKIGAIFLLSGAGASWGEDSQLGADLAVAEINSSGGINGRPLEIVYEDNQGDDAKIAVSALNKFIRDGVKIVLGTNWTPSGLATAPVACDNEVLMISPTLGVAEFNESCDSLFNLWTHDDNISRELGAFIFKSGHTKLAIIGSLQEWDKVQAEAIRDGFESAGGQVVSLQLGAQGQTDYRTEIAKIKNLDADAVALTNIGGGGLANSAIQIRELGLDVLLSSVALDSEAINSARGALEGAIIVTSLTPTEKFSSSFRAVYGRDPEIGADTSYDAVKLIAEAIRETGLISSADLSDYLNSLDSYSGASGQITFDGKGGVEKESKFMIVEDGNLVSYESAN